jgi:hypothetical protein
MSYKKRTTFFHCFFVLVLKTVKKSVFFIKQIVILDHATARVFNDLIADFTKSDFK